MGVATTSAGNPHGIVNQRRNYVADASPTLTLAHLVAPPTALRPGVVSALRADLPLLLHVKQL